MNNLKKYNFSQVFVAACVGMLLFGIVMFTLGSTLPNLMDKFALDELGAGLLASLLPLGILLGSIIFGPVVDRYSYRYLLISSALAIGLAMLGIAYASGFLILQVSFFCIGFGGGLINGATNALVADISVDYNRVGSANLSLLGIFYGVGALVVPTVLGLLSNVAFESILIVIALIMILTTIYFSLIRFPAPKQVQRIPISESLHLLNEKVLWIVAFLLFFQSAFEGIFNNWTTIFLQRERSFANPDALFALSVFLIGLTITRFFLVGLLRRVAESKILFLAATLLLLGVLLMSYFENYIMVYVAAAILGIGTSAIFPISFNYVSNLYQEMRGRAFSFVIFIAVLGNIIMNYLMGILSNKYGIDIYRSIMLFCILILFLLVTLLTYQQRVLGRKNVPHF